MSVPAKAWKAVNAGLCELSARIRPNQHSLSDVVAQRSESTYQKLGPVQDFPARIVKPGVTQLDACVASLTEPMPPVPLVGMPHSVVQMCNEDWPLLFIAVRRLVPVYCSICIQPVPRPLV